MTLKFEKKGVVEGDFNYPLNLITDRTGGSKIPRQSVINAIEHSQTELIYMMFGG